MREHQHYPRTVLNLLASDPLVRWGCTASEIIKSCLKSLMISIAPALILSIALPFSPMVSFGAGFFVMFIGTIGATRFFCYRIAQTRADKPPFYDKHLLTVKKGVFIKATRSYQRERKGN